VSLEQEAGSGERGKRERGARIVVRNPKIKKFYQKFKKYIYIFLNLNFSENFDLLL
jgi:hypothetical protein